MWPGLFNAGHAVEEGLKQVDMARDDNEHLEYLSEEALVDCFWSVLPDRPDLLPNLLLSAAVYLLLAPRASLRSSS